MTRTSVVHSGCGQPVQRFVDSALQARQRKARTRVGEFLITSEGLYTAAVDKRLNDGVDKQRIAKRSGHPPFSG